MPHKEIIEDIVRECCPNPKGYCFLKELTMHNGTQDRLLVQLKCVEIFKYERSREAREDVGWEGALRAWNDEGYARDFADVYKDGMKPIDAYIQTMNRRKE